MPHDDSTRTLVAFLRARYAEQRKREEDKRRTIPSVFDGHDIEIRSDGDEQQVLVDGHPYPANQYWETATEPAPDPEVLADLDAKLAIVDAYERAAAEYPADSIAYDHESETGRARTATLEEVVCLLATPHRKHPDYPHEEAQR